MLNNFVKTKIRNENETNLQKKQSKQNSEIEKQNKLDSNNIDNFSKKNLIDLSSPFDELFNLIRSDLDSIDSENMLENLMKLLSSIQEDVTKKFQGSKYQTKIQEIFENNFEMIVNYFVRCLQHTDAVKNSVKENLAEGFNQLNQIVQGEMEEVLKLEVSQKVQQNKSQNLGQKPINISGFVFDEEFVTLINLLSSSIKDLMKNSRSLTKPFKTMDLGDSYYLLKSCLSDIFNNKLAISQQNNLKLKIQTINEKIEDINNQRTNFSKSLKLIDTNLNEFYEDAKGIFKKLKKLHNEKLNEIQKMNEDFNLPTKNNLNTSGELTMNDYTYKPLKHGNYNINQGMAHTTQTSQTPQTTQTTQTTHTNLHKQELWSSQNPRKVDSLSPMYRKLNVKKENRSESRDYSTNPLNNTSTNYSIHLDTSYGRIKTKQRSKVTKSQDFNSRTNYIGFNNNKLTNSNQSNLDELRNRNTELLEEISSLHKSYVNSQNEISRLQVKLDQLEKNNLTENEREGNITTQIFNDPNDASRNSELIERKSSYHNYVENYNSTNINSHFNNEQETRPQKRPHTSSSSQPRPNKRYNPNNLESSLNLSREVFNTSLQSNANHGKKGISNPRVESLFTLSGMVLQFIRQMSNLQEAISQKADNIKELKKKFEEKKKELIEYANIIKHTKDSSGYKNKNNLKSITETKSKNKKDKNIKNSDSSQDFTNFIPVIKLQRLTNEFNLEKENLSSEINHLKQDNLDLLSKIEEVSNNYNIIQLERDELILLVNELNSTLEQIRKEEDERVKNLQNNIEKIPSKREDIPDPEHKLIFESKNLQNKLSEMENTLSIYKENEDLLKTKYSQLENTKIENELKLEEINKKLQDSQSTVQRNLSLIEDRENQVSSLSKKNADLKTEIKKFKEDLSQSKEKINLYKSNEIKMINENQGLTEKLNNLSLEYKQLESDLKSEKEINKIIQSKSKSNKNLEEDLSLIIKEKENLFNQMKESEKTISNLRKEKESELYEFTTTNSKLQKEIENLKTQIKSISTDHEDLKNKNKETNMSLEKARDEVKEKEREIEDIMSKYNISQLDLKKTIENLKESDKKNSNLNKLIEVLKETNTKNENEIKNLNSKISLLNKTIEELNYLNSNSTNKEGELTKKIISLNKIIDELKDTYTKKETEANNKLSSKDQENENLSKQIAELKEKNFKILKEKEIIQNMIKESTNKNTQGETEKQIKKISSEKESIEKEYSDLSNMIKILYDTISKKYKEATSIFQSKSPNSSFDIRNRRQKETDFLQEISIKEETSDAEESVNSENTLPNLIHDNNKRVNETLHIFISLLAKLTKINEEKNEVANKLELTESRLKKSEKNYNELDDENKKMRLLFEECTASIYEAIKETSPHMLDEMNCDYVNDKENLLQIDSKNSVRTPNTPHSEVDAVTRAVELFKKYNEEMFKENAKLKNQLEETETNARRYKIMSDEYKSALDLAINRNEGMVQVGLINNTNPNSSVTFTKENLNNFTVDDLMEINASEGNLQASNNNFIQGSNVISKKSTINLCMESTGNNRIENDILITEGNLEEIKECERCQNCRCKKEKLDVKNKNVLSTEAKGNTKSPDTLSGNEINNDDEVSLQNEKLLEKEKEISDLIAIQDDLVQKLAMKDEEVSSYKEACSKLLSIQNNPGKSTVPLEKYQILLEQFTDEQERLNEISIKYEVMKRDFDLYKSRLNIERYETESCSTVNKLMVPPLNLQGVNKSFNDECEGDKEEDDKKQKMNKSDNNINVVSKHNKSMVHNNTVGAMKSSGNFLAILNNRDNANDYYVKTQGSVQSKKTENTLMQQEALKDAIAKYEEHEELLAEQLQTIKKELKATREERDLFKRKFEESITLADGKKNEVLHLLRQAIERLIVEITMTNKIKELLSVILRVLDYTEEQIQIILNSKDKKKNFFNFFNK